MILFLLLIVILLTGLTAAAVLGKIGGFMASPTSSQSFGGVPSGALSAEVIAELHFDQALRGYRMNQVDEVIDALVARNGELESQVAAHSLPAASSGSASSVSVDAPLPEAAESGDSAEPDVRRQPQE